MRVLIIVVCIFVGLLLLVAGVLGLFWWYKGGDMVTAVEQGTQAGVEYGKNHDDMACRDRGFELMAECDGFTCGIYDQAFVSACLSQASKGDLCDEIPTDLGFSSGLVWVSKQCQDLAQEESECASVMQTVLEYCAQ